MISRKPNKKILFHSLIIVIFIISLAIWGCPITAQSFSKFTQRNIIKLKIRMTSEEVIQIFGYPLRTSASTCGQALGKPWKCISWYYDSENNHDANKLTFQE